MGKATIWEGPIMSHSEHDPENLVSEDFVHLESIRGLAAFAVVLNHSRGMLWEGGAHASSSGSFNSYGIFEWLFFGINQLTRCGYEFVILFFVLSGFSIAHSLRVRSKPTSIRSFFARRAIRLYPPYIAGLTLAFAAGAVLLWLFPTSVETVGVLHPATQIHDQGNLAAVIGNLLYDPSLPFVNQYWSLGHEVVFYILAPWLIRLDDKFLASASLLWILGAILTHVPGIHGINDFWSLYLMKYNTYFAFGILLYRYYPQWFSYLRRFSNAVVGFLIVALFLAMVSLNMVLGDGRVTELVAVCISLLAIPFTLRVRPRSKILYWLGEQSYSLYVTHIAVIAVVLGALVRLGCKQPISSPYLWVIAPPICLIVSRVVYNAVEVKTRFALEKLRQRTAGISVADEPQIELLGQSVAIETNDMSADME
jgi:peptidoglycan/LPS O-acetylase OafA/YrhL